MSINEYDDFFTNDDKKTVKANEYDSMLDSEVNSKKIMVENTVNGSLNKDPARSAEVYNLAKETKLPTSAIDRNLDKIKEKKKLQEHDYDELLKVNPGLSKWLSNPDNAAIAHGEIEPLKRIEQNALRIKPNVREERFTKQLDGALFSGFHQLNNSAQFVMSAYGLRNSDDAAKSISESFLKQQKLTENKPGFAKEFTKETSSDIQEVDENISRVAEGYGYTQNGEILKGLKEMAIGGGMAVGEAIELITTAISRPKGLIYASTESLANSFPSLLTGLGGAKLGAIGGATIGSALPGAGTAAGATIGGAVGFGAGTFAGSILTEIGASISEDLSSRGIDLSNPEEVKKVLNDKEFMKGILERAERKGVTTAAVDGIFNMFAGKNLGNLKGQAIKGNVKAFAKAGAKDLAIDATGEGFGEYAGQVAREKGDLTKASLGEAIFEGTVSLGSSVNDVLIGAGTKARDLYSKDTSQAAQEVVNDFQNANESIEEIQALGNIIDASKEAENTSQAVGAFKELVNDSIGDESAVFFQSDDWDSFWTNKGENPLKKAYEISDEVGKSYAQSSAMGADIQIPITDFVEKVAKTDDAKELLKKVKTRADGMNIEQAQERIKELPGMLKKLSEEATQNDDPEFNDSLKEVKRNVKEQLKLAGFKDKDADLQASLYEARIKTRSLLRGEDPKVVFQRLGLTISKPDGNIINKDQTLESILARRDKQKQSNLDNNIIEKDFGALEGESLEMATTIVNAEIEQMIREIELSEQGQRSNVQNINKKKNDGYIETVNTSTKSTFPKWYGGLKVRNKNDFNKAASSQKGAKYNRIKEVAIERLKNGYESNEAGRVLPNNTLRALLDLPNVNEEGSVNKEGFDLFQESIAEINKDSLGFYSKLGTEVSKMDFKAMPAKDLANRIKKLVGIKQDELDHTGIVEYLNAFGGKITKEEVKAYLDNNGLQIKELTLGEDIGLSIEDEIFSVFTEDGDHMGDFSTYEAAETEIEKLQEDHPGEYAIQTGEYDGQTIEDLSTGEFQGDGPTKYGAYTLDGGENYREVLMTLPESKESLKVKTIKKESSLILEKKEEAIASGDTDLVEKLDKEFLEKVSELKDVPPTKAYLSSHYDESNILAHFRLNDRVDNDGKKVLFIEEIQSDWHQDGRKKGYKDSNEEKGLSNNFVETEKEFRSTMKKLNKQYSDIQKYIASKFLNDTSENELILSYASAIWDTTVPGNENFGNVKELYGKNENDKEIFLAAQKDEKLKELTLELKESEKSLEKLREEVKTIESTLKENKKRVPDAPFKQTEAWTMLAFKRVLDIAVSQGYESVSWTPGQVQADRYNLSKQVKSVSYRKFGDKYALYIIDNRGNELPAKDEGYSESELEENLGKDITTKILNNEGENTETEKMRVSYLKSLPENTRGIADEMISAKEDDLMGDAYEEGWSILLNEAPSIDHNIIHDIRDDDNQSAKKLEGVDLSVGGEGMISFYDKMLPKAVGKYIKKLDKSAKVGVAKVDIGNMGKDPEVVRLKDGWYAMDDSRENQVGPFNTRDEAIENGKGQTQDVWSLPLTEKIKNEVNKGQVLFQGGKKDPRGKISVGKNKLSIELLASADPSTLLHETGHLWLEEMREDFDFLQTYNKDLNRKQKEFLEDSETLLKYLGVESFNEIGTDQHELFARSIEKYLGEGKAPSEGLQRAFSRFRIWLISVYQNLKNIDAPLTDEVRQVFDRMLATEEEINNGIKSQSIQSFMNKDLKGKIDKKKLSAYESLRDLFTEDAKEKMTSNLIQSWKKENKIFLSEEFKSEVKIMQESLEEMRPYQALDVIKTKKTLNGETLKINRKELVTLFGEEVVSQLPKEMIAKNGGMAAEMTANLIGYQSAKEMIEEMQGLPKIKELAKKMAEERIKEKYKDIFINEEKLGELAQSFIHSDKRSEVLLLELSLLSDIEQATFEEGVRRSTRRIPSNDEIKKEAKAMLSGQKVKSIKPHLYQQAEVREARKVEEFIAKNNYAKAFEAKQKELLNHQLYREALAIKDHREKALKRFKNLKQKDAKLAKTRDMTFINAARSILSRYELTIAPEDADAKLSRIEDYDPDVFQMVNSIIESVKVAPQNYKEITQSEFEEITDVFNALWDLSKSSREIEVDGVKKDITEIVADMELAGQRFVKEAPKEEYDRAQSKTEEIKEKIMSQLAKSRRLEHWIEMMDMGDIKGVFRKYLFTPISEATDRYFRDRDLYTEKIIVASDALKKAVPEVKENKSFKSNELKYEFKDIGEILGALIHTGNPSNFKKLLVGRGWGALDANGQLVTARWDKFVERMIEDGTLKKEHYDFVQTIWDITEEIKPMAQKAHKDVYGFYFDEVTFHDVVTPFGTYKGGYVPAKVDFSKVRDAGKRDQLKDLLEGTPSLSLPGSGGNGFGKNRQENYNRPLALNINLVAGHIDEIIRFSHVKAPVVNAVKILKNPEFRNFMDGVNPTIIDNMIFPALVRADKNKSSDVSQGRMGIAIEVGNKIKKNASQAIFFGHIRNTVEQLGNIIVATTKVDAKDLLHGAMSVMKDRKAVQEIIYEKSTFMLKKVNVDVFEQTKRVNDLFSEDNKLVKMRDFAQDHAFIAQNTLQGFQDEFIWIGIYDKAVQNGLDEKAAVRQADSVIRTTQNGTRPMDISSIEGNPMLKLVQMFMGFFNNMANLNATNFAKIYYSDLGAREKTGKALYAYLAGYASIAIVSSALRKVAAGGLDEDEDGEILDDLYQVFIESQVELGLAMMPLIGPAIQAGMNRGNQRFYDNKIGSSPVFESIANVADYIVPDIGSKRPIEERVKARDLLSAISVVTGLPIAPLAKPYIYLRDVNSGKAKPKNPIDFTRGLITGKKGVK